MHILHVVGARPNFMKVAPVIRALESRGGRQTLVHTGQHYDAKVSDEIFRELELPEPDINLGVGSGSHAEQTAQVLVGMERVFLERPPDLRLVYGDVNSTVAAALAAVKVCVEVGHVGAGLRSGDRTMMRAGATPIWYTTPGRTKSASRISEAGAPNARSAAMTRAALSGAASTQISRSPVALGRPCRASA